MKGTSLVTTDPTAYVLLEDGTRFDGDLHGMLSRYTTGKSKILPDKVVLVGPS